MRTCPDPTGTRTSGNQKSSCAISPAAYAVRDAGSGGKYTGRSSATRPLSVRTEYGQPIRSAITVAGICGNARSSSRTLAELGERWQRGTASVAQEHFATNVIRGRLAGLARGWGSGQGPRAILACPPGELHDMGLMIFGIVLNRHGWRIDYFGMSTPVEDLEQSVEATRPDLVVIAATLPETLEPLRPKLAALARRAPLALAGAAPRRRSRAPWGRGLWRATW